MTLCQFLVAVAAVDLAVVVAVAVLAGEDLDVFSFLAT